MKNLKLAIELLPKGAWENNLRITLPKKDWDSLRNIAYERAKHKCTICGNEDISLDAHEVWSFNIQTKTQSLEDIIALCSACHGVKHMRNSERIGYGEHAKSHFLKINKCNELTFANHALESQMLFDERNQVYRWKLNTTNLDKFGGKGMVVEQKEIPMITNPYESIDWETDKTKAVFSFSDINPQGLTPCPKVLSVSVDNYQGTINVSSKYTNKIEWVSKVKKGDSETQIIKTLYNNVGKFLTSFNVKNIEGSSICFILSGDGGKTSSELFEIVKEY